MANTGHITNLRQNPNGEHLIDNTDAIHSGIIKALNIMAQDSYVAYGCSVTQSAGGGGVGDAETVYTVANGGYFRNGDFIEFSQNTVKKDSATQSGNGDWYAMIVIDTNGALQIRGTSALGATDPKGADPDVDDIPICMVRIQTGQSNVSTREIQYLTSKTLKRDVSVGRSSGSAYVEAMGITASSTVTQITNLVNEYKIKLNGTAATNFYAITDSAAEIQFKVTGEGNVTIQNNLSANNGVFTGTVTTDGIILTSPYSITSPNSMIFQIDSGNTHTDKIFQFKTHNTQVGSLDEAGNMILLNNLQVGGVITKSGSAGIGADLFNQATVSGTVNLANFSSLVFIGGTAGVVSVGILKTAGNIIQNATGSASITFGGSASTTVNNNLVAATGVINQKGYNAKHIFKANSNGVSPTSVEYIRATPPTALLNPIDPALQEVCYIGFNRNTHSFQQTSAQLGLPNPTANATDATNGGNPDLATILTDEETKVAVNTFGGMQGFIALANPTGRTGQQITLKNISQYTVYVLVPRVDGEADKGVAMAFDGGLASSTVHTNVTGQNAGAILNNRSGYNINHSNRIVDATRVISHNANLLIMGYQESNGLSKSALMIRPNESVTCMALEIAGDNTLPYKISSEHGGSIIPQWYVINETGTNSLQSTLMISDTADMYLPVSYSGTLFISSQNKTWYLPDHPPVGTQYSIACVANTQTIYSSNDANHQQMSIWGGIDAVKDSMYLLDTNAVTTTTVTATNAKTFIYTADRTWTVIG
tara:strand:+ start:4705 stop:7002 length:2298 start_codon:yes stop_codon:yes gene_type:complete